MPQLHISSSLLQKSVLDREAERQRREVSEFLSVFVSPIPRNSVKMLERKKKLRRSKKSYYTDENLPNENLPIENLLCLCHRESFTILKKSNA